MQNKEEKQAYLREAILNPGYDPAQFVTFLNTKLPIGDNIDLCSLEELEAVVQQFLAFKAQEENTFQPLGQMQQSAVELAQEPIQPKSKPLLFTNYNPHMLEPEFSKTFQCKKIIDKYNHVKSLKCIVSKYFFSNDSPQRKSTDGFFGIGGTSFLQFKVQTIELNWKVGRRYSDFMWLREYLRKVYPTYIIPPVPQKKAAKRTQRHIEKRMKILEYFLNDLVSIRQILNDPCVQGFLSITDHTKFQNLKKQSNKVKPFQAIADCQKLEGKVTSKLSEENKTFLTEMQKNIPEIQRLYKQITRGGKTMQEHITAEVNTLYEIGNHFADLHQLIKVSAEKIPKAGPIKSMNDIYITLNNMMIEWGNLLRNQHQFLQKNFNTFFKYLRNELYGFSQVTTKEQQLQMQYNKFKVSLQKKKDKIYALHDPQKWDLSSKQLKTLPKQLIHDKIEAYKVMLPKQNATLEKMRSNLFLYIEEFFENGVVNFERNCERYCDNFKEFAINIKVNNQQLGEMWMEMAANFSAPDQKPHIVKIKPEEVANDQIYDDF